MSFLPTFSNIFLAYSYFKNPLSFKRSLALFLSSSGVSGAISSMGATSSANAQFVNQINAFNQNISGFLQRAAVFQGQAQQAGARAQMGGQIAGLGMQAFSMSGASFGGTQEPTA